MRHKVVAHYPASIEFEISIDLDNGSNYLVIFGKHINGHFCSIPNWGFACEMSDASDTFYNTERLEPHLGYDCAREIALAISEEATRRNQKGKEK